MRNILLIDDSALIRSLLSSKLKEDSFTVYTAKNGIEALDIIKQNTNIDLIITDIVMPHMDGIKMLEHLQTTTPIPSIIVTANYSLDTLKKAKELNVKKLFSKPVDYVKIKATIDIIMNQTSILLA